MKTCEVCGQEICPERLEVLPNTTRCTQHSNVTKQIGFMIATAAKGTAAAIVLIPQGDKEQLRLAKRAHLRSR